MGGREWSRRVYRHCAAYREGVEVAEGAVCSVIFGLTAY